MTTLLSDPANLKAIESLRDTLRGGRTLLLVGAGCSARLGYPLWGKLVHLLREEVLRLRPQAQRDVDEILKHPDSTFHASEFRGLLGNDSYLAFMRQAFGPRSPTHDSFHETLLRLPFTHVLTTNYDAVLEHAHASALVGRLHRVLWHHEEPLREFIQHVGDPDVPRRYVYLHGHIEEATQLILTQEDYAERYGRRADTFLGLYTLLASQHLLSVGFSLSDLDLMHVFRNVKAHLGPGAPRHFAVLPLGDGEQGSATRRWLRSKYGIEPIFYTETPDHRGLGELLDLLTRDMHQQASAPVVAMVATSRALSERALVTTTQHRRPLAPPPTARQYLRLQRQASSIIEQFDRLGKSLNMRSVAGHVKQCRSTLRQDLYAVAVTGKSRAGKSTLLNAMLGRTLCPAQDLQTTAVPIVISTGEREEATVYLTDEKSPPLLIPGPLSLGRIAPFADQAENPGNQRKIHHIEIRLLHEVLDLGVAYVDIPGIDDPDDYIKELTDAALERAHALVYVMDVSPFQDGGYMMARETVTLLKRAQEQGRKFFLICNKADRLSESQRHRILDVVARDLARYGLSDSLAAPPFLLSAKLAADALSSGQTPPNEYALFAESLWRSLWHAESIGLRRLYRVFDQLRRANEDVASLIATRQAQGPQRERIRDALARCEEQKHRIHQDGLAAVERAKALARSLIADAQTQIESEVRAQISRISQARPLPRVSNVVSVIRPQIEPMARSLLQRLSDALAEDLHRIERQILVSLTELRADIGLTEELKQIREQVAALPGFAAQIDLPSLINWEHISVVAGTGLTSWFVSASAGGIIGASIGVAFPLGALLGAVASIVVDHFHDRKDSPEKLAEATASFFRSRLKKLETRLETDLSVGSESLAARIDELMMPFMEDMRQRLDGIREPTADEVRLHGELTGHIRAALQLLEETFQQGSLVGSEETPLG